MRRASSRSGKHLSVQTRLAGRINKPAYINLTDAAERAKKRAERLKQLAEQAELAAHG
jgi:hypothetical protein